MDVERVELLADLEHEHAQDDHADQHVEGDAQLHHHRHAVGGAGGGEEEAVLHGEEADHLRHGLGAGDHHEEGHEHARQRDAERAAGDRLRELRDRQRQVEGEDHQHDAHQHHGRDVDEGLDVPLHVQLPDEPVQDERQDHHLEHEGDAGRPVEMVLAGHPGHRHGGADEGQPLQREQVDEHDDAALREHREGDEQQDRLQRG